jgi:hypothetical protein
MAWEQVVIDDQNRLAQAGVALVEQTLFSNAENFPHNYQGHMALNGKNNAVEVTSPVHEFVLIDAEKDQDGTGIGATVFGQETSTIVNDRGQKLQSYYESWKGNALDNAVTHYSQMNMFVRDSDNSLLFKMAGVALPQKEALNSSFGTFKDDYTKVLQDGNGNTVPLQIHFSAYNMGNNQLDIVASVQNVDAAGNPTTDSKGVTTPPSTIEMILSIGPARNSADFRVQQNGFK